MNVCVIVTAAGKSERYGESDKLAQDLGGRAVLLRTVEAFAKRQEVGQVLVAGPPHDIDEFRGRYGATLGFHGARIVPGGESARWETVRNALQEVPDTATHVAVHDAARPAVLDPLLNRVFEAAATLPAVIPAIAADSTIKRGAAETVEVDDPHDDGLADSILGGHGKRTQAARAIVETVDRKHVYLAQTPQVFQLDLIRRAYEQENLDGITDDAQAVERLGEPVYLVDGDPRNVKLTTPADLELIRCVLGLRAPKERPVHKRF